ncbi:MAG: cyclase family protein [Anaerolineae bacterium]|jgi:kynurenine formamidase
MLIDVSMPIVAGSVFRRGTPPVEIATRQFYHQSEGEYQTVMLSLPAHTATHVDLVFRERRIAPERMIGPGKLLDVTGAAGHQIQLSDVKGQAAIQPGDFVFFRTDWSDFAGTDRYHEHPELSVEVVHWLASKEINAVGIDASGLGRDRRHGDYDRLLADSDVFVIENLANLRAVPTGEFTVYCLPLSIESIDAIPARVLVGIGEDDERAGGMS